MRKIIFSIVALIFVLIWGFTLVKAVTSMADLKFDKTTIKPGETFKVLLYIACENEINGIETSYSYDTSKLELISANAGENFASLGEENKIELITNKEGIKEADVFILNFKAKDSISSESTANISIQEITVSPMSGEDEKLSPITKSITIKPSTQNDEQTPNTNNEQQPDKNKENEPTENENSDNDKSTKENTNNTQENKTTDNTKKDSSKSDYAQSQKSINDNEKKYKSKLPYTGKGKYITAVIISLLLGTSIFMYLGYKKYKSI